MAAIALIGILLASGCTSYYDPGPQADVDFETIYSTVTSGGMREPGNYVIKDETLWNALFAGRNIVMPDFDEEMAIGVFSGDLTMGGFSIEITRIAETEDKLIVYVKETHPSDAASLVLTSPGHIVKLAKNDKPVVFNYDGNIKYGSEDGFTYGIAPVGSVDIITLKSFPAKINAVIHGYFPDGCTEIDKVAQKRDGNGFMIEITTKRPTGPYCTQSIVPFEKSVALDVYGLPAGNYTVNVNGAKAAFEMAVDNIISGRGIEFNSIASGTYDFDFMQKYGEYVINNQSEWDRLFAGKNIIMPDFGKETAIAVIKQHSSGGYSVEITRIEETPNGIVVYVRETTPPEGALVTMSFTTPYHIVKIAKTGKPVSFVFESIRRDAVTAPGTIGIHNVAITDVSIGQYNNATKQMPVTIKGQYGGRSCTTLNDIGVRREGNAFFVDVTYTQTGAACTRDMVLMEKTVYLDMSPTGQGPYMVSVNGLETGFAFSV